VPRDAPHGWLERGKRTRQGPRSERRVILFNQPLNLGNECLTIAVLGRFHLIRAARSGAYGEIRGPISASEQALAEEAVRLQLEHRSRPKDQALLSLLTKGTSKGWRGGSTKGAEPQRSTEDQQLIAEVMERFGYSEEEAIKQLTLFGPITASSAKSAAVA
jgi:hypothetical protein